MFVVMETVNFGELGRIYGPFATESDANSFADRLIAEADKRDLRSGFSADAVRLTAPEGTAGALGKLVEYYLRLGAEAEAAGLDRRAASYRSIANMIGAITQGAEPVGVDFLARYPE